jgi:prephenate dehydrogenase
MSCFEDAEIEKLHDFLSELNCEEFHDTLVDVVGVSAVIELSAKAEEDLVAVGIPLKKTQKILKKARKKFQPKPKVGTLCSSSCS